MITIPNDSYHAGRTAPIRLVVLHTAECPCAPGMAASVARYLAQPTVQASAHYVVDPGATVAQIAEQDTAWAAPGANSDGIQIEQAGRAAFTATDWSTGAGLQMLEQQTVPLVADICRRLGLPALWLTAADLLAGRRGITDHVTVNQAYGKSDHTDCGGAYPGQLIAQKVNALLRAPTPTGDDMAKLIHTPDGTVWSTDGVTAIPLTPSSLGMLKRIGAVPTAPEWGETVTDDEAGALLVPLGDGRLIPMRQARTIWAGAPKA